MNDPYFRKIYKSNISNQAKDVRLRNTQKLQSQKVIDLLENS